MMTKGIAIQSSSSAAQQSAVISSDRIHEGAGVFTRITSFDDRDLTVHFWDFGGQVMAHATHQFFLRAHCLYVVVLDARVVNNANEDAEYWLEHVRAFGDNAPVMLVGNKIDQMAISIDVRSLKDKHPNVIDFYPLSCTEAKSRRQAEFDRFSRDFHQALMDLGSTASASQNSSSKCFERSRPRPRSPISCRMRDSSRYVRAAASRNSQREPAMSWAKVRCSICLTSLGSLCTFLTCPS
jgi:hypothetical protein